MHMIDEPHGLIAYVKKAADTSDLATSDSQVQLQAPIARMTSLSGPSAPAELDADILGFNPSNSDISFNSRGMPCLYSGGYCTNRGFRYYFKDDRSLGESRWSAMSISPVGRIKKWFWNGSAWGD